MLRLQNNKLSGTITPDIENMTYLRSLDVRYNNLTGRLPSAMTSLFHMRSLYWIQSIDTENQLCAPTYGEFQEWLGVLNESEGPNCSATAPYATQGIGQSIIQSTSATSWLGPDGVYTAEEDIEVAVSLYGGG